MYNPDLSKELVGHRQAQLRREADQSRMTRDATRRPRVAMRVKHLAALVIPWSKVRSLPGPRARGDARSRAAIRGSSTRGAQLPQC